MKSLKYIHKLLIIALCVALITITVIPASGASVHLSMRQLGSYFNNYHKVLNWGQGGYNGKITVFQVNGDYAFCTQAGRMIKDSAGNQWNQSDTNITANYTVGQVTQDNSVQSKIAYLGFLQHQNDPAVWNNQVTRDWYYAMTQMMIWQSLPASNLTANGYTNGNPNSYFTNSTMASEYANFKTSLQKKIDTWSTRPGFDGYTKKHGIKAGESVSLTDTNGVFEDYGTFTYTKGGITVTHTKGSNTLHVTAASNCSDKSVTMYEYELVGAGAQKYSSNAKATYIYEADSSQNLAIYGNVGDPIDLALSFNVETVKGKIAIEKTKAADASSSVALPEANAEFQVYLKTSGSYDLAPAEYKDVITTNSGGYAITKDLPHGTYRVHQTKGAEGHKFVKDFDVVIGTAEHNKTYTYKLTNETYQSKVQIVKKDIETGKTIPLAGTEFELTNLTTGEKIPGTSKDGYFVTDKNGTINLATPLYYGKYLLTEKTAPTGYILSEPMEFTVDGQTENLIVEAKDMSQKGIVKIEKKGEVLESFRENEDGTFTPVYMEKPLKGAVFNIIAKEDIITNDGTVRATKNKIVDTITTDQNGEAQSKPLYLGKYEVVETEVPEGYVLDKMVYDATLKYEGQSVKLTDKKLSLRNVRQKVNISLAKAIEEDELYEIYPKDTFKDIKFGIFAEEEIIAADGSILPKDALLEVIGVEEVITAEESKADVPPLEEEYPAVYKDYAGQFEKDLPFGNYYVKEIATNEQYIIDDTRYPMEFLYQGQDIDVVNLLVNGGEPIKNNIIRSDIVGYKTGDKDLPLEGAVFGLFNKDEKDFIKDNALLTAESDEDGYFCFHNVAYGDYVVCEIGVPKGYLFSAEIYKIKVEEQGEVIEITAKNTPKIGYMMFSHHAGMMDDKVYIVPSRPKTGDNSEVAGWLVVMLISASFIVYGIYMKKNEEILL